MSEDLNLSDRPSSLRWDLVNSYKRQARLGWFLFLITLLTLLAQNILYSLLPKEVMASEDGKIVGQVIFDEPRLRMTNEVMSDMRSFVRKCISVDKENIWDDLAVCFSHMSEELSEMRINIYEQTGYIVEVEERGCNDVDFDFNQDESEIVNHKPGDYYAEAILSGEAICMDNPDFPISQVFKVFVAAKLVHKNTSKPYGLEVTRYEDI